MIRHAWSRGELVPEMRAGRPSKCSRCGMRRKMTDNGAAASPRFVIVYGGRQKRGWIRDEPPCLAAEVTA